MKSYAKGLSLIPAALVLLASCASETPWGGSDAKDGKIALNLTAEGSVNSSTRGDDQSPLVPAAEQFAIDLVSSDGSYSKSWATLQAFNKEEGFPMGNYTITASYGDIDSEGFTAPYFKGSAQVAVQLGQTENVNISATLANCMVSVRYTDSFLKSFAGYSASLTSPGHEPVIFAAGESRPAYMAPSTISLGVTLTNDQGQSVTVNPASFVAQARYHYIVTIDVDQSGGSLELSTLKVTFEESVQAEPVEIPLTDELFSAPTPYVTPNADAQEQINSFTNMPLAGEKNPEFHVFAFGGFKSASLTVSGGTALNGTYELVNADADTQAKLKTIGIDCAGLFRNNEKQKMAVVNFRDFIANLSSVGDYKVSMTVTDALGRTIAPKDIPTLQAKVSNVEYEIAAEKPKFLGTDMALTVSTNCPELKNAIKFNIDGENATYTVADVPAVSEATRANYPYQFKYNLKVKKITDSKVNVKTIYGTQSSFPTSGGTDVDVDMPQYTVDTDAFAKKVRMRVNYEDETVRKYIVENATIYKGSSIVQPDNIKRNADTGIIEISGLNSATPYNDYSFTLGSKKANNSTAIAAFTTEAETDVPNGNFASLETTINISKIDAGGQWQYGANKRTNYSSILVSEPTGWASVNAKTCYENSSTKNTWFMVPSTLAKVGEVLVRSVAYDHAGTLPSTDNMGVSTRPKYSQKAPSAFAGASSGELFLGTYSFNGSESRSEGVGFSSRPSSMTFTYTYIPYNNESGEVYVKAIDASNAVIWTTSETISLQTSQTSKTIALPDFEFGKKIAKLVIGFKSTKGDNISYNIPTGEALKDTDSKGISSGHEIPTNEYKSLCVGSQLTVTSVKLNY